MLLDGVICCCGIDCGGILEQWIVEDGFEINVFLPRGCRAARRGFATPRSKPRGYETWKKWWFIVNTMDIPIRCSM